ncbi:MAG: type II toxin-antitoxin system prevent-host-death family antitoxin [Candidatus Cloacimonadota bacterium]|nr:type II toxin-antitoxin system prevent-host-death family antitoxin [Thermodesulfobacteriota bacterium]MEA2104886.1 type II toxin-antitoxin system prevent-host-death family antitoxin [Candidatus Cloacimonadota bacterium]
MDAIAYSNVRKKFVSVMENVCDNHDPVIITRKNSKSVVMMSLEDYNAIEATMYLLRSPANAAQLRASIAEFEAGNYKVREMIDDDCMD